MNVEASNSAAPAADAGPVLPVAPGLAVPLGEIELTAVRAQGAGGQNVNKVSTAIHLRFDVRASSLPHVIKERLLDLNDQRISKGGVVVIKAQSQRSQEANKDEALGRLAELIRSVTATPRPRKPTHPTLASRRRRLEGKVQRGELKAARAKIRF